MLHLSLELDVKYVHFYTTLNFDAKQFEVRASQLAQASERVGSPIPASQQG